MNRNRVASFGIFLVLFCCTAVPLKAGGYGEYGESSYRAVSSTTDSRRRFEQMMEQRDIKMAINTLVGEGFTPAKFRMLFRIDFSAFVVGIGPGISVLLQGK